MPQKEESPIPLTPKCTVLRLGDGPAKYRSQQTTIEGLEAQAALLSQRIAALKDLSTHALHGHLTPENQITLDAVKAGILSITDEHGKAGLLITDTLSAHYSALIQACDETSGNSDLETVQNALNSLLLTLYAQLPYVGSNDYSALYYALNAFNESIKPKAILTALFEHIPTPPPPPPALLVAASLSRPASQVRRNYKPNDEEASSTWDGIMQELAAKGIRIGQQSSSDIDARLAHEKQARPRELTAFEQQLEQNRQAIHPASDTESISDTETNSNPSNSRRPSFS